MRAAVDRVKFLWAWPRPSLRVLVIAGDTSDLKPTAVTEGAMEARALNEQCAQKAKIP